LIAGFLTARHLLPVESAPALPTIVFLKQKRMSNLFCRPDCGACCTAPSISSPIPGMPDGKPAGVRCIQLDDANGCRIFGQPERPAVCGSLQPEKEMCGDTRTEAMFYLSTLERLTSSNAASGARNV
jgi:hypothetical protein